MDKRFSVAESRPGVYEFTTQTAAAIGVTKIYVTLIPTKETQDKKLLVETSAKQVTIKENFERRPYFIIENADERYVIGTRNVPISGMNNFRDMGGYAAGEKHVKWGALYRSDQPGNATAEGLAELNTLGIHTVIDYRSSDEIRKYPNPEFPAETTSYHLDPNAHAAELSAQFQSSKEEEDAKLIASIIEQQEKGALVNRYDIVMEQYKSFATKEQSKQAFGEMLKIIAKSEAPAVDQHCRGGKDRTGFGAMLVLGILGVSKKDIVADYMLTYSNRLERNEIKMAGYRKIVQDESVLNYLYSLIETRPEFIEASYDGIIAGYGTIDAYVTTELAITASEIAAIRSLYLE